MDIIFYHPTFDTQWWIEALQSYSSGKSQSVEKRR